MEKRKKGERYRQNKAILHLLVCISLLAVIWGGFMILMRIINQQIEPYEDDFSWVYQVDSVKTIDDELVLSGFAFELGKDAVGDDFEIVLQELETGKNYFPKMQYSERKDVNDYFLCEYDYLNSGFTAKIKADKLDLQNGNYEVLLQVGGTRKSYQTGTYISDGQLMFVNPNEYVPLEVGGTELEKIVEKGVLRVYRPDVGMYVYQYEGELYWIADEYYEFKKDNDAYIQYNLFTTQVRKLPIYRQDNNYYWDSIGFWFEKSELKNLNTNFYRVSVATIPTEYSITEIATGYYEEVWKWKENFRPWYVFD